MVKTKVSQAKVSDGIEIVMEKLSNGYYKNIESICITVRDLLLKLKEEDVQNITSVYSNLCMNVVSEIQHLIQHRIDKVTPYINELSKKVTNEHNCMNCAGKCETNHEKVVNEIADAHYAISNIFSRLQKVTYPLYSKEKFPETYKVIRSEMMKLQTMVNELFYYEESILLPKIIEAQIKIYATDRG